MLCPSGQALRDIYCTDAAFAAVTSDGTLFLKILSVLQVIFLGKSVEVSSGSICVSQDFQV